MEIGSEPVADVIKHLANRGRSAWGRWALERVSDDWWLRHAEFTVGTKPIGYAKRAWRYDDYAFIEGRTTMRQIEATLSETTVRIGKLSVQSAALQNTANRSRLPSFTDYGGHRLPWPVTRYELSRQEVSSSGTGLLVSLVSPSFPNYEAAFSAFFWPEGPLRWQQQLGVVVIDADADARISGLTIRPPGEIIAEIAGHDLSGCALQLSSRGLSRTSTINRPGRVSFPLPNPFDSELMITLADDHWRDFRIINPPGMPNRVDPSIVWDDPKIELQALIAGGEGARVEFKSEMPDKKTSSIETALKVIPAFANGDGGILIIGVDDYGAVIGINEDPSEATARLRDLIHGNIHPVLHCRIERHKVASKVVLLVRVDPGQDKPYSMFRNPPKFFARHGATTFHATREEIIQLSSGYHVYGQNV